MHALVDALLELPSGDGGRKQQRVGREHSNEKVARTSASLKLPANFQEYRPAAWGRTRPLINRDRTAGVRLEPTCDAPR